MAAQLENVVNERLDKALRDFVDGVANESHQRSVRLKKILTEPLLQNPHPAPREAQLLSFGMSVRVRHLHEPDQIA